MATKTIIFDLGGVYFTDGTKQAIHSISEKYNIPPEKIKAVPKGELGTQYRTGEITADIFWEKAKNYWGIIASSDDLANMWLKGYEPIDGTANLIQRIKKAGHELLFLSDNVKERVEYLSEKYNFLPNFKDGVFSHEAGIRKPNPKIYQLVLEKASNIAENCVYIDDKLELLEPAKKLGMEAVQFIDPNQVESELRKLGVEFEKLNKELKYFNIR